MSHPHLKKIIPIFLLGLMLSFFSGALCAQTPLQIHYINVEQGQSTLIIGPNGTTILFDGGYETKGTTEVVPYLQSIGIPSSQALDYIIPSHHDTDHYVGLTELINYGYNANHVYDNGSDKTNTYWVAFVDAVTNHTTAAAITTISPGTVIDLGYGATATCVATNGSVIGTGAIAGGTSDENDRAICLLIKYNGFDFLLNGDMGGGAGDSTCTGRGTTQINMESPTVRAIMPAGVNPLLSQYGVEVAHVGHHGSESSTNADYMNILTPRVACISVGAGQGSNYYHPRIDVVEHVLLAGVSCITAPAALVLQTEEGSPPGATTSFAGNCVGDIVISTDGINSYTVSASGAVSQGPDERVAAGLPATFYFEEYSAADNAPIIYYVNNQNNTTTSTDIVWSTNETANSVVKYGTTSGSYTDTVSDASLVLTHTVAIPNLTESTTYYYVVESTDATSNKTTSPEYSFQTLAVVEDTITITSPNGGENWGMGTSHNITWTSTGTVGNVNIDYSTDSGSNWTSVVTGEANDGSYTWTVPNTASTTCLVRVQEADGNPTDSSDAIFSIVESMITVTSPNGGESWTIGENHAITWTSIGTVGNVNIDYSTDSGSNWISVATDEANDGSYTWTVPNSASTTCLVRVQEADGSPTDSSNAVFTISASTPASLVVFSEVYYDTIGTDNIEEWVELYNNSATTVDISSWTIRDNNGTGTTVTIPTGTTMAPGTYLTVALDQAGFRNIYGYDADIYRTGFLLGNNGDVLILKDSVGTEKDAVSYKGGSSGNFPPGWGSTSLPSAPWKYSIVRSPVTTDTNTFADWIIGPFNGNPQTLTGRITVTSSNGGESWTVGDSHDITWSSTGTVGNVNIDYSINSGTNWTSIATDEVNDGSYTWTVPNTPSTTCLVRVQETDGIPTDKSNAVFTIVAAPTITVTSPNGGESWTVGSSHDITWTSTGTVGVINIVYTTDGGSSWNPVVNGTDNDGSYTWTIPNAPSTNCKVQVSEAADDNPADQSDAVFTIVGEITPTITVTLPNGGESWTVGSSHDITWASTGTVGSLNIDYSTNSGTDWTSVAIGEANDGSYTWTIPNTASTTCLVRVQEADGSPTDNSNVVFTIAISPTITVTSPNGGESWTVGSSHDITWTTTGTIANVNIDYSTNSGSNWTSVVAGTANNGSYTWTVPNMPSTTCLVRVTDATNSVTLDTSNALFTIAAAVSIQRLDFIGTWDGQGVYYRNSDTATWVQLASPATLVTAGDLDGDNKDDLIGIWPGQGGVWAKYSQSGSWAQLSSTAIDIASGDMNGDGRDDLVATWDGQGVYYKDSISGAWVQMATPATLVAAGDLDGDGKDDLIGIWPSQGGVWVKYSQSGSWVQLSSTAVDIAAGDMNGDGRDDLVATWDGQGVYYKDSISGAWVQMATPAEQVTAGDLDGDGKDDLIGIWPSQGGAWVKYSSTGSWAQLSSTARHIAAGLMRDGAWGASEQLAEPMGGVAEGPGDLIYQDMAAAGPGDRQFQSKQEKNLTPQDQDVKSELQRVPGPGEDGFQCLEQENLVPGSETLKKSLDKNQHQKQ